MEKEVSFSGGEVRQGSNAVYGTEVWNRDPLPKPPPPKVYTYKLTVKHPKETIPAQATAPSFEVLIDFEMKMRDLGYEFISLERLEPIEGE